MDFLSRLLNQLSGKSVDDKTLLAQEQQRLVELQAATARMKERREVRSQLIATRKESKELEEGLGKRSRLVLYVVGLGALLVVVIIMKSCIGC